MKKKIFALALVVIFVSSCSWREQRIERETSDHATVKLAEAASSIDRSLTELARIQTEATPPTYKRMPDPNELGIAARASVDWSGPVGPLVDHIAHSIDYHVRIYGHSPAIPIIITMTAKDALVTSLLRDIDFQAGTKAHVEIRPREKLIEIFYAHA